MAADYLQLLDDSILERLSRAPTKPNPRGNPNIPPDSEFATIKPEFFGGDPTAESNRTLFTRTQHFEYVAWWNKFYHQLKTSADRPPPGTMTPRAAPFYP